MGAQISHQTAEGKFQVARASALQVSRAAQERGFKEIAALTLAWQALADAEAGNAEPARGEAEASLVLSHSGGTAPLAAIALALAGDGKQAGSLGQELSRKFPDDSLIHDVYLPALAAAVAAGPQESAAAAAQMEYARRYDFGFRFRLLPIYLRARAYLAAGQAKRAAADFQSLIDHRGVWPGATEVALAHLGLARAYAMSGERAKSRTAYQDFLALWKDADPDLLLLRQAKAEYAKTE
jgi:hypothetical protein